MRRVRLFSRSNDCREGGVWVNGSNGLTNDEQDYHGSGTCETLGRRRRQIEQPSSMRRRRLR